MKDEVIIGSTSTGFVAYKGNDTIHINKDSTISSFSTELYDSIYTVVNIDDSFVSNFEYRKGNTSYLVSYEKGGDSLDFLELNMGVNPVDKLGTVIRYNEEGKKESVNIMFSYLFEDRIMLLSKGQYVVFINNKIDSLESSFYTISNEDSCNTFELMNGVDHTKDFFYQLISYNHYFGELNPIRAADNVFIGDTSKHKGITYFNKGSNPSIEYCSEMNKPKVYQLYVFESGTHTPLYYRLGVIRDEYSTIKEIRSIKKILSKEYDFIQKIKLKRRALSKFENFDLVAINARGEVDLNKQELNRIAE